MNFLLRIFGRCVHAHTTFPLTTKRRVTYVVCLACKREFRYLWSEMRLGEEIKSVEPFRNWHRPASIGGSILTAKERNS